MKGNKKMLKRIQIVTEILKYFTAGRKAKNVTTYPARRETTYPYCPCYL